MATRGLSQMALADSLIYDSRGKGIFYQSDVISVTGILHCLYDYGTENPRKPAEIPREVNFLAIAPEFRGIGNRNPAGSVSG